MDLDNLMHFIAFTHKFAAIKRRIYLTGQDEDESDMEHSYQLALTAWYLVTVKKLILQLDKVLQFALVHDLVETYAGDTFFHSRDQNLRATKIAREAVALKQIIHEFPEFPDLGKWITSYEERIEPEAKFVYALDKMLPVINIYLDQGRSWARDQVTLEMILTKDAKIKGVDSIWEYWEELKEFLRKEEQTLFSSTIY
ncbi:MAG: HD domain-containing protein [bacterium]